MDRTQNDQRDQRRINYEKLMPPDWVEFLWDILDSEEMQTIEGHIRKDREKHEIFPRVPNMFNAFRFFRPKDTKVVLLGQDPYPKPGQAIGLSFGVNDRYTSVPTSLRYIDQEISRSLMQGAPLERRSHQLTGLAKQGVLLLNASLTVRKGQAGSHSSIWEPFTAHVLKRLSERADCIFILMGRKAQYYGKYIGDEYRMVQCPHPAAEAYSGGKAGFVGSGCFGKTLKKLKALKRYPVDWTAQDIHALDIEP